MKTFTVSRINHHSFLRWSEKTELKKNEKAAVMIFNPELFDEDTMERDFMLTAFSA